MRPDGTLFYCLLVVKQGKTGGLLARPCVRRQLPMEELGDSSDSTACLLLRLSSASQPSASVEALKETMKEAVPIPVVETAGSAVVPSAANAGDRRSQVAALPRKEWNEAEDALIKDGVERLGCRWRVIAAMLPGRSDDAVRNRWSRLQESYRGAFSKTERLGEFGGGSSSLADSSDGNTRVGSSNSSNGQSGVKGAGEVSRRDGRPDVKGDHTSANSGSKSSKSHSKSSASDGHENGSCKSSAGMSEASTKKERTSWTRSEDDVIMQGVAELGHKWYEIARRLPGRTDHAIRNRWSRLQSIMQVAHTNVADG